MERYREGLSPFLVSSSALSSSTFMNVFELTRALIDIDSVTPNEERVGDYLVRLSFARWPGDRRTVERMDVEPHRFNVFAHWGEPVVTFSTHMDTVPPFFEFARR